MPQNSQRTQKQSLSLKPSDLGQGFKTLFRNRFVNVQVTAPQEDAPASKKDFDAVANATQLIITVPTNNYFFQCG